MEFTLECRINKELKKILENYDERISRLEEMLKEYDPLDLNRDGKIDKADSSIAGKVLADRRKRLKG